NTQKAVRAEIARLQADQGELMAAADHVSGAPEGTTFYRQEAGSPVDLPWDLPYTPPEERAASVAAEPGPPAAPAAAEPGPAPADAAGPGTYAPSPAASAGTAAPPRPADPALAEPAGAVAPPAPPPAPPPPPA